MSFISKGACLPSYFGMPLLWQIPGRICSGECPPAFWPPTQLPSRARHGRVLSVCLLSGDAGLAQLGYRRWRLPFAGDGQAFLWWMGWAGRVEGDVS